MDDLQEVLRMGTADAPNSYAANSNLQANAIANVKPVVVELVEEICSTMLPEAQQLVVADLGCSFGPNAFSLISEVMGAVAESCRKLQCGTVPEVQFFLNDLPTNDFNNVFRSLAPYKKKFEEDKGEELAGRFFVAAAPGSFHGRLFPCRSVHLFHSSSSIHWLSQVPEGLKDENNNELNKGNIYMGRTSPPCVHKVYLQQFQRDFSTFLRCRSEEIKHGGLMVLTLIIRTSSHPYTGAHFYVCELISEVLMSMANEGTIKEVDIDAFNLPFYNPSMEELRAIVNDQGAFQVDKQCVVMLPGDGLQDDDAACKLQSEVISAHILARTVSSAMGPLFACHFQDENIIDEIFTRLAIIFARVLGKGEQIKVPFGMITLKRSNAPEA